MIIKDGKRIDGLGDSMPIGSIIEYDGTNVPDGWEVLTENANVYVGSEQPTEEQGIWIKKGKNHFDKRRPGNYGNNNRNQVILQDDGTIKTTANYLSWHAAGSKLENLAPNTTYCVSGTLVSSTGTGDSKIAVVRLEGYNGSSWVVIKDAGIGSTGEFYFTFNSGTYQEIYISLNAKGTVGESFTAVFDKIQVEAGSAPTEYEEYIDPIVYIQNNMGTYEKLLDKKITYYVYLKGGDSFTFPKLKRYVDIYFGMTANGGGMMKYTIDREGYQNTPWVYGSGLMTCHDTTDMLEYYASESKLSGNTLTHVRCGFINISKGTYTSRDTNSGYFVYKVETYD